ncbi:MAG TPA: hypothetical protein VGF97_17830 [Rhizomicrobium sp.]|jgi:hypothetical protein
MQDVALGGSEVPRDPVSVFCLTGLASEQERAYSLPIKISFRGTNFEIGRRLNVHTQRGQFPTPEMTIEGANISLSYLMVGNAGSPRLSRGIFQALMREARVANADGHFDYILHANRQKCLSLLEALEPHDSEVIVTLRQMLYFQLETMAFCIGTREL